MGGHIVYAETLVVLLTTRLRLRMPGDHIAIEDVARGDYMKWSIAEAPSASARAEGKNAVPIGVSTPKRLAKSSSGQAS